MSDDEKADLDDVWYQLNAIREALPPTRTLAAMLAPSMPERGAKEIWGYAIKLPPDERMNAVHDGYANWAVNHADATLKRLKETEPTT